VALKAFGTAESASFCGVVADRGATMKKILLFLAQQLQPILSQRRERS
jgi:hypothetical protein